jgi:6-phosphogluconate dehydrogenase
VLLKLVETFVKVVAHYGLRESPQYMKASNDQFIHKKALAGFGINVALACQAFKTWDTGKTGSITDEELKAVFRHSFNEELSKHFVQVIMDVAHEKGNANEVGATCEDLVHIMSSGIVSIEEVQKLKGMAPNSGTKVTPAEDHGEAPTASQVEVDLQRFEREADSKATK